MLLDGGGQSETQYMAHYLIRTVIASSREPEQGEQIGGKSCWYTFMATGLLLVLVVLCQARSCHSGASDPEPGQALHC